MNATELLEWLGWEGSLSLDLLMMVIPVAVLCW